MKEERLTILKLIEDGKVSAADGVKLLNALREEGSSKKDFEFEENFNKVSSAMDSFVKDAKEKFCDFAKEAEPKVKKTSQSFLEKTSEIFEEVSKNLRDIIKNDEEESPKDVNSDNNDTNYNNNNNNNNDNENRGN